MSTTEGQGRRGSLSKDVIVSRTIDLARSEGLSGITMHRIAALLGVEAMSLYHHIPTKASQLMLMADWSLSRVPPPDPELPWQDQIVEYLVQTFLAGVDNPVLFEVIASEPPAGQHAPRVDPEAGAASASVVETVQALLDQSFLPLPQQVHAPCGLMGLLIGFIVVKADGFLTTGTSFGRPRETRPDSEAPQPSPRLAHLGPLVLDADPALALRESLGWFLRGLSEWGSTSAQ